MIISWHIRNILINSLILILCGIVIGPLTFIIISIGLFIYHFKTVYTKIEILTVCNFSPHVQLSWGSLLLVVLLLLTNNIPTTVLIMISLITMYLITFEFTIDMKFNFIYED